MSTEHPSPDEMARANYKDVRFHSPVAAAQAEADYASGIAAERARLAAWLRDLIAHPKGKLIDQVLALANDLDPRPR